jgi:hypothetical protein
MIGADLEPIAEDHRMANETGPLNRSRVTQWLMGHPNEAGEIFGNLRASHAAWSSIMSGFGNSQGNAAYAGNKAGMSTETPPKPKRQRKVKGEGQPAEAAATS